MGKSLTEKLLARGDRVAATMRDPGRFEIGTSAGDKLWTAKLDVIDTASIRAAVAQAFDQLGHVDVVVSNAGYGLHGAAEEATDEQVEDIIATNLVGSIQVARAVTPYLRAQGGGRIIQISSMAGHLTRPGSALYSATKWGVEGFFETLAKELAPFGIQVNILAPGLFATGFHQAMERGPELKAYAESGVIRPMPTATDEGTAGDLDRLIDLIIEIGEGADFPMRLFAGSDSYQATHRALSKRLATLEAQRTVAYSTDRS
jgi:NAD(P)-dependent dehydrogenase (short-subunit alcohol dehydrogenase family)